MSNVITEYQKWKRQGEDLRVQAKQAMESRFRELLTEAVNIAGEYRADFGGPLKLPAGVTAFRFKSAAKSKPKNPAKPKEQKPDPKFVALEKRLAGARKKLEAAKTAGTPTRTHEDKIYEIEDALRLATQPQ